MSNWITLDGSKITGRFCGPLPTVADADIVEVPEAFEWEGPGANLQEYDESWNLRPITDRVKEGLVELREDEKTEDGHIVPKSDLERIRDGIDKAPDGFKIVAADDGTLSLEAMSLAERVTAGQLTQETADILQAAAMRYERNDRFASVDDARKGIERKIRRAKIASESTAVLEAELEKWEVYGDQLADIPQQGGFPWNVSWPARPDGVEI